MLYLILSIIIKEPNMALLLYFYKYIIQMIIFVKVFDNKYLNLPIERIIVSKINITKEPDLIKYIKNIIQI